MDQCWRWIRDRSNISVSGWTDRLPTDPLDQLRRLGVDYQSLSVPRGTTAPPADRAQAEQIDFLNGMVILLFGLGLFIGSASVLLSIGLTGNADQELATANADDRLAEDILVTEPATLELDEECATAFFELIHREGCAIPQAATLPESPSEDVWLRSVLGLEDEYTVNVTVFDANRSDGTREIVTGEAGPRYAIGPEPPVGEDISSSHRYLAGGQDEYYTLTVRVW